MKKIAGFLLILIALFIASYSYAADEGIYNSISFDKLELVNDGTDAGTYTYSEEQGTVYFQSQIKQGISAVPAKFPEKKYEGSSLTSGMTDMAAEIYVQPGSSSSCYFALPLDTSQDMYGEGKLMLAFNAYIAGVSGGSHAPLQVDIRNTKDYVSSLIAFRSSKLLQTYINENTSDMQLKYTTGKWYYIQFIFDTENMTYTLYIDGEEMETDHAIYNTDLAFAGDKTEDKKIIKEIRFSVNNGKNSTGTRVQVDDIYFGVVPGEKVYEFEVKNIGLKNASGPITTVYSTDNMVCAQADITYAKEAQNQKFSTAVAMYRNGKLEKLSLSNKDYSGLEAGGKDTVTAQISLEGVSVTDECTFKAFAWKNDIIPMAASVEANGCEYREYLGENPTIYLVGDSICMDYKDNYYPQQGWGYMLRNYVKDNVTIENWAQGGRSTKSFIGEGRWDGNPLPGYSDTVSVGILDKIQPGDYVMLAMGHNDNNTSDQSKYTTIDEYKDYLRRYIDDTKSKGAGIVFATSITQAGSGNSQDNFKNTLLTRADAMKEVAEEKGIVCLDVNAITFAEFTEMGWQDTIYNYFMAKQALIDKYGFTAEDFENHPNQNLHSDKGGSDLTHVTVEGADLIARRTVELLRYSDSPLKGILKDEELPEQDTADKTLGGKVKYNLYPDGKNKAITMSFDDGKTTDRELVNIFNENGLKATFNIVPTWLDDSKNEFLKSDEIKELYSGHEVAAHGNTHSRIETQTPLAYAIDLLTCRTSLQNLLGYKVRGYAAPFGGITNTVDTPLITKEQMKTQLKEHGVVYNRLSSQANSFELPDDFYEWKLQIRVGKNNNTADAFEKLDRFISQEIKDTPQILMIFGHGHEIADYRLPGKTETGYELFNKLCQNAAGHDDIWYATCIEIADYINAVRSVTVNEENNTVTNSSDIDIWATVNGTPTKISAGETIPII